MKIYSWYSTLKKPTWAPPASLFAPVWAVLYILMLISYGYVLYAYTAKHFSFLVLIPFFLNLFFNIIFTSIQFGLKNNLLAALDILLVLGTLVWALVIIYPFAPWVSFINTPYLLWVCFATILQLTVTKMNL